MKAEVPPGTHTWQTEIATIAHVCARGNCNLQQKLSGAAP